MSDEWEAFTNPRSHITLRIGPAPRAQGGLTVGAYRAIGEPERVMLLYSPDRRAIGLRAAHTDEGGYRVNPASRQLGIVGFLAHYGLDHLRGRQLPGYQEGDMLVFPVGGGHP